MVEHFTRNEGVVSSSLISGFLRTRKERKVQCMRNRKRKTIIAAVAVILVILMVLSMVLAVVRAEESEAVSGSEEDALVTVPITKADHNAVYIDDIDVTNMSFSQAEKALQDHMEKLKNDPIVLRAGSREATVSAGELGLDYNNKKVVDEALSIGNKGNVLKRFRAQRQIAVEGPIILDLDLQADAAQVADVISKKESEINCSPQPNGLYLNKDRKSFTITPTESGVQINEAGAVEAVNAFIGNDWHGGRGTVELPAELTAAEETAEQLEKVRRLLGEGETYFDSTNEGRATNISLATSHINGTVVYPGEEFSSVEAIGPTTEENGFMPGASYAGDRIVETYGGGVCQVTSTLYRAVLESELEVTERHNHTMMIHYAEPGMDATMSDDALDFRFINSTDSPIYIEGSVDGDTVTFRIYGEETRDPKRSISFESREITTTDYETVYLMDENEDFGTLQEIYGEEGVQAELWKIISVNGEFESEEKVNVSLYSPLNHAYIVGTKGASDATIQAIYTACAMESLGLIYDAIGTGTMAETIEVPED